MASWTPAFVVDSVAATLDRAVEHGLLRAISAVASELGVSSATIGEWVARARAVPGAPVPPGLATCHTCDHPMILVQLPESSPVYLCMPTCGRTPVPAQPLGNAVAQTVLHHIPHLVPRGMINHAAAYAPGGILRVAVGAKPTDLHIIWRSSPWQLVGPRMAMAQRLDYAHSRAGRGDYERAVGALRTGLLYVDPTDRNPPLDVATASAAALLAELTLTADDLATALPWARWAYRFLRHLLAATSPQARAALKVLADAHRRTGDLTEAANCYRDLACHHSTAEGPRALPTLAAQATLALVLYQDGHCAQARQLLARTAADHLAAHAGHRDGPRLRHELARMRASCTAQGHRHSSEVDNPPLDPPTADTDRSPST
ncbi:hypothetical protein [Micromonospora sp. CA-248212]|uniref:hypothetical protein n=1 Tax=Micromonospora sp. CA-248212 TaxID=3239961 RepID=UPI003D8D139D